jgi:serine/threonine protein kinase
MIGEIIANYEVKSLLGAGGMGTVYLAEHIKLGRKVAIKSLHPQFVNSEEIRVRFIHEAKVMGQLQHPNIVTLYDYVETETGLFLIIELVDGKPIDDYIEQVSGPIEENSAVQLMTEILEGFQYAHEKGLVHRDIKPSNLVIAAKNKVKILDFGIAKLVGDTSSKMTKTGTQIGTVYYMSPEQVKGDDLDQRSDIYALGVTFFQMLTGNSPYKGMTKEFDVFMKIVNEELPDPRTIYPGVSEHMCAVIQKATAKDANERFQSCDEFAAALKDGLLTYADLQQITEETDDFQSLEDYEELNPVTAMLADEVANQFSDKENSNIRTNKQTENSIHQISVSKIKSDKFKLFGLIGAIVLIFGIIMIYYISKDGPIVKPASTTHENNVIEDKAISDTSEEKVLDGQKEKLLSIENNNSTTSSEVLNEQPDLSPTILKIGQNYQGGIIFYLDNSGQHGKVCAENDLGQFEWEEAKIRCRNLELNNYSDWYLPTKAELKMMYKQQPTISGFANGDYWSSTVGPNSSAWYFNFSSGEGDYDELKLEESNVCPVRAF